MRPRRAICVSRDEGVRRVVGDALATAGLVVEHLDGLPVETAGVAVVVVDRATRKASGDELRTLAVPVVVVGDDLDDEGLITLMLEQPVSHLIGDPKDRDLGITSEKLATGDVFGLEKYLAAGAKVGERVIRTNTDKRRAMDEVCSWAEAVGARRPIVHRLASVIDELLMNALHDTPAIEPSQMSAVLRWASDDRMIAISVGDGFGALRQRDVIDNVRRARNEGGRPQPQTDEQNGAGLGLYLVLANVASLIVNVSPGRQTEVVCLFDLKKRTEQGAVHAGVRSLHVFAAS
jgi:anti-sigma regulatory factor (Ser/Thr protein kinase)